MQLIWDEFLKIIKEEAGTQVVETWFKAVTLDRWNPETKTIFLHMPNSFVSSYIQEHYTALIETHLSRLFHVDTIRLFFFTKNLVEGSERTIIPASPLQKQILLDQGTSVPERVMPATRHLPAPTKIHLPQPVKKGKKRTQIIKLNSQYTFDTLVVGNHNSLAHAAAVAVSQSPGTVYNPLFIYGGTGLGKTHLLHAIGNEMQRRYPAAKIAYESADHFIHEFIHSISLDKTRQFRDKFQKLDLLLLDDIQFFSRKEQTQEIFFHIFNALTEQGKQIVFSSDTLPKDIVSLQHRLKSRLQNGLIADIQLPNHETKMAILKKKATLHKLELSDEVASYIASLPASSIRELEGFLVRIAACSSLMNQTITLDIARKILTQFQAPTHHKKESSSLQDIIKTVAEHFDIPIAEIKSNKRSKQVAFARQITFYIMKKISTNSLETIGSFVGGRDHSTVIHAARKIESLAVEDQTVSETIKHLEEQIHQMNA